MGTISLEQANRLIAAALAKGRELALAPLTVVVLDSGGVPVALQRQDGSSLLRTQIAIGKASGALGLGVSSRRIGEMAAERPAFIGSLASLAPNGVIPAAGGVVVLDDAQTVAGAVGVTGDTSDNDELCALAGIEACGLSASA